MIAKLARPGLNQIISVIQLYQAQAISDVNQELQPIVEFHKGPKWRTAFPWLMVAWAGTEFIETSQQTRMQRVRYTLQIEAGQFDSEFAQDISIDYARMIDHIFNDLAGPPPFFVDWETVMQIDHETVPSGYTDPWVTGSVKEVFIERTEQSLAMLLREEIETPVIYTTMDIRFDLQEV
jgi:hypothetical protein